MARAILPSSQSVTALAVMGLLADDVVADSEGRERIARGESDSYRVLQRFVRPDGSSFLGDLTVSTLTDADDAVLAYVVQIVDVTERQEAREEAAAAREEMRGVIDSLLDPWVYLVAVRDDDGRISLSGSRSAGMEPVSAASLPCLLAGRNFMMRQSISATSSSPTCQRIFWLMK